MSHPMSHAALMVAGFVAVVTVLTLALWAVAELVITAVSFL